MRESLEIFLEVVSGRRNGCMVGYLQCGLTSPQVAAGPPTLHSSPRALRGLDWRGHEKTLQWTSKAGLCGKAPHRALRVP